MPIQVSKTIMADDFRRDDYVEGAPNRAAVGKRVIGIRKRGPKLVHVQFDDDVTRQFPFDAPVQVLRTEQTESEVAEMEYRHNTYRLESTLEGLLEESARAVLRLHLESERQHMDYDRMSRFMETQERESLGLGLEEHMRRFERAGMAHDVAIRAAFGTLVLDRDRRTRRNPLSRSTATLANLMEDVRKYVEEDVLEKARAWGAISEHELMKATNEAMELMRAQRAERAA